MQTRVVVLVLGLLAGGVVLATTLPSIVRGVSTTSAPAVTVDGPAAGTLQGSDAPGAAGARAQIDAAGAPPARALDPLPNSATQLAEPGTVATTAGHAAERGTAPVVTRSAEPANAAPARPSSREITLPAGTQLRLRLEDGVGSDTSRVEDAVRARLANPVVVNGWTVVPAGSLATGHVTAARQSGRVKGRAYLAMRFTSLTPAHDDERYAIRTNVWGREARATKKKDAAKIAIPAGAGAVVGGIIGGKKGAAIGAGVGGGAGTGVVLSTRGEQVRLGPGATIVVRLSEPITVRVPS